MWFLFWNENALIYHVTWEILSASCRGGKGELKVWLDVCDAWGLPREPPACCKAIPVIQGLVPEAVTTEISVSKYWVDWIIALLSAVWFLPSLGVLYWSGEWDPSLGIRCKGFKGPNPASLLGELFHEQCALLGMKPAPDTPFCTKGTD